MGLELTLLWSSRTVLVVALAQHAAPTALERTALSRLERRHACVGVWQLARNVPAVLALRRSFSRDMSQVLLYLVAWFGCIIFTPRADDLHDLYDLYDLGLSGQIYSRSRIICMI